MSEHEVSSVEELGIVVVEVQSDWRQVVFRFVPNERGTNNYCTWVRGALDVKQYYPEGQARDRFTMVQVEPTAAQVAAEVIQRWGTPYSAIFQRIVYGEEG